MVLYSKKILFIWVYIWSFFILVFVIGRRKYLVPALIDNEAFPLVEYCDAIEVQNGYTATDIVLWALALVSESKELVEIKPIDAPDRSGMIIHGSNRNFVLKKLVHSFAVTPYRNVEEYNGQLPDVAITSTGDTTLEVYKGGQTIYQYRRVGFEKYDLKQKFGLGGQGEVWQAVEAGNEQRVFVLKRVFTERGEEYRLAGNREVYFGERFKDRPEIARYVESFNSTSPGSDVREFWLVFENEGESLDALLYTQVERTQMMITVEPSRLWHRMREDFQGALVRREIMRQIVTGLEILQRNNVVHRDIKPSNVLISDDTDEANTRSSRKFRVKIADFGSALDSQDGELNRILYGKNAPSDAEETKLYRPPEAVLSSLSGAKYPYLSSDESCVETSQHNLPMHAYDMWSVGVIALEMLVGNAHIFEADSRSKAKIDVAIRRDPSFSEMSEDGIKKICEGRYFVSALERYGIDKVHHAESKQKFAQAVAMLDPLGLGFTVPATSEEDSEDLKHFSENELDFVWRLLRWSPFDRPTAKQILHHPYFV